MADYVLPAALKYSKNCGGICSFCVSLSMSLSPEYFLIYKKLPKKKHQPVFFLHSLKLTVRPYKWMVGIRSFPIGFRPIFRGKLAVSFREGNFPVVQVVHFFLSGAGGEKLRESWLGMMTLGGSHMLEKNQHSVELLKHYETLDFT